MAPTMKTAVLGTLLFLLNGCAQNENELIDAVTNRQPERVRTLLETGVDLEARNEDGATALILAAFAGETEIVQTLVNAGADIDASNNTNTDGML